MIGPRAQAHDARAILAAGGVLLRKGADGIEAALVHRRRYQEWALPKGKLDPGESPIDAAIREVKEETGEDVIAEAFVGSTHYLVGDAPKTVLFWRMAPRGGGAFVPSDEIDRMVWLPATEASERLAHEEERRVLRSATGLSDIVPSRLRRRWWKRDAPLKTESFEALKGELLRIEAALASVDLDDEWGRRAAIETRDLIRPVQEVAARGGRGPMTIHEAWSCLLAARRALVWAMTDVEVTFEATALGAEVKSKLKDWRRDASLELLEDSCFDENHEAGDKADLRRKQILRKALELRDGQSQNAYRDADSMRKRVTALAGLIVAVVAGILVVLRFGDVTFGDVSTVSARTAAMVFLFGFLGGALSAFAPLSKQARSRFPEDVGRWSIILVRPLIGAAAALALYPLSVAGLLPIENDSGAAILGVAFVAGFSERLLTKAVASVAGEDKEKTAT